MRWLLSIAFIFVLFASCKKLESPVTREDELRSGRWKMSAGTIKVDAYMAIDTTYNYYDSLPECKKDDYMVFKTNYDATQNSGNKCDESEPDEIQFRWALYDNGNGINFWYANETFFGQPAISAPFINYTPSRFTIRYVQYYTSQIDKTKKDTLTFTHTFVKS